MAMLTGSHRAHAPRRPSKIRQLGLVLSGKGVMVEKRVLAQLDETDYLLASKANREHLMKSLEQFEAGEVRTRKLR